MKKIILCILFCLAVMVAPYVVENNGYVFISVGDYTIETSLLFTIIVILVTYLVIALFINIVTKLVGAKSNVKSFFSHRRSNTSKNNLSSGVIAMAEHRYADAEEFLIGQTHKNYRSASNYILASYAAIKLGKESDCLECLDNAVKVEPKAQLASLLIKSDYYLKTKKYDNAAEVLEEALKRYDNVSLIYRKLAGIYILQSDYDKLKIILAQVKKKRIFSYDDFLKIQHDVYRNDLAKMTTVEEVQALWESVTRSFKKEPSIKGIFACHFAVVGAIDEAEKIFLEGFRKCDIHQMLETVADCEVFLPKVYSYVTAHFLEDGLYSNDLPRIIAKQNFNKGNYSEALTWYKKVISSNGFTDDYYALCQCYEKLSNPVNLEK